MVNDYKNWLSVQKGDYVVLTKVGGNRNTKLKEGDRIRVVGVERRNVTKTRGAILLSLRSEKSSHHFKCSVYRDDSLHSDWNFYIDNNG